ncbi:hypoxanthine phosphoribosyltransferase [Chloroflexota bacterium]
MNLQPEPSILLNREEIGATVSRLAGDLNRDYRGRHPLLIGVLKGSFIFMADLVRRLDFPLEVEFVQVSSYSSGMESSGTMSLVHGLYSSIRGRDVLLIEDIVDTGLTISFLIEYMRRERPVSLKLCALMDKPSRRQVPVNIDFLGFTVPGEFLVGYGLDYDERYRNLPDICILKEHNRLG